MIKQTLPLEKKDLRRLRLNYWMFIFFFSLFFGGILYIGERVTKGFQNFSFYDSAIYVYAFFSVAFIILTYYITKKYSKAFKKALHNLHQFHLILTIENHS